MKPWDADKLQEYEGRLDRRLVENELGTNKGKRILAAMTEVLVIPYRMGNDPNAVAVWRVTANQAEQAIEKANLDIIWKKPDRIDFAWLLIKMDLEQARSGVARAGTGALRRTGRAGPGGRLQAEPLLPGLADREAENREGLAAGAGRRAGSPRGMQRPLVLLLRRPPPVTLEKAREAVDDGSADGDDRVTGDKLAATGDEGLFEELFGDTFDDGDEANSGGGGKGGNDGGDDRAPLDPGGPGEAVVLARPTGGTLTRRRVPLNSGVRACRHRPTPFPNSQSAATGSVVPDVHVDLGLP